MIPDQTLSSEVLTAPYIHGEVVEAPYDPLVDNEPGGVALNDPSQGLFLKIWTLQLDGDDVVVSAADVAPTVLFSRPNITELSLAFDQNMRPTVCFVEAGVATVYWFDTLAIAHVFTVLPGASYPRCTLDDKRQRQLGNSDVIVAYMIGSSLYFRAQRDRYQIQYLLGTGINRGLHKLAMNNVMRLQFQFGPLLS